MHHHIVRRLPPLVSSYLILHNIHYAQLNNNMVKAKVMRRPP
jgi:hypothetical protein